MDNYLIKPYPPTNTAEINGLRTLSCRLQMPFHGIVSNSQYRDLVISFPCEISSRISISRLLRLFRSQNWPGNTLLIIFGFFNRLRN